jgi:hypothetical protein
VRRAHHGGDDRALGVKERAVVEAPICIHPWAARQGHESLIRAFPARRPRSYSSQVAPSMPSLRACSRKHVATEHQQVSVPVSELGQTVLLPASPADCPQRDQPPRCLAQGRRAGGQRGGSPTYGVPFATRGGAVACSPGRARVPVLPTCAVRSASVAARAVGRAPPGQAGSDRAGAARCKRSCSCGRDRSRASVPPLNQTGPPSAFMSRDSATA